MFSEKEYDILIIELYYLKKISDNVIYIVICFNREKFTLVLGLLRVPELPLPFPSAGLGSINWVVTGNYLQKKFNANFLKFNIDIHIR